MSRIDNNGDSTNDTTPNDRHPVDDAFEALRAAAYAEDTIARHAALGRFLSTAWGALGARVLNIASDFFESVTEERVIRRMAAHVESADGDGGDGNGDGDGDGEHTPPDVPPGSADAKADGMTFRHFHRERDGSIRTTEARIDLAAGKLYDVATGRTLLRVPPDIASLLAALQTPTTPNHEPGAPVPPKGDAA